MIEELTKACVHCGFCLPTCPTYVLWSEEMDSPRGRIQLMEKTAQGTLALSPTVVEHFDRCLGCMACVSSCPSGVQYDRLIEETRRVVEAEHPRPRGERLQRRLLFATLPHPRRMRWALRLAPLGRVLPAPAWARPMLDVAPRWRSGERPPRVSQARVASTRGSRRVGLLTGCVQSVLFGDVNVATARVLAAAGYEVVAPTQGCCGALSAHAGRAAESARFTRRLEAAFAGLDTIVVNASGCGSHLKDHGVPVLDVTEALVDAELPSSIRSSSPSPTRTRATSATRSGSPLPGVPCSSGSRASWCWSPPSRTSAAGPPGSTTSPSPRPRGSWATARPPTCSRPSRTRTRAPTPGASSRCRRRSGRGGPALHPVELLDASLRGVGAADLLGRARR